MMCEQVRDGRLVEGLRTGFGAQKGLDTRDSLPLAGLLDQHPEWERRTGEGRGGRRAGQATLRQAQGSDFWLRDRTSADKSRDRTFGAKVIGFCPESPDSRPRRAEASCTRAQPKHARPPSQPACHFRGNTCTTHGTSQAPARMPHPRQHVHTAASD